MRRVIRRYGGGSRKLYDTKESRYVSLREIADWIRRGQELRVVDSRTNQDVTAHTLAQVISADERRGGSTLTTEFLHDIIRRGSTVVLSSVDRLIQRLERSVSALERRRPRPRRSHVPDVR